MRAKVWAYLRSWVFDPDDVSGPLVWWQGAIVYLIIALVVATAVAGFAGAFENDDRLACDYRVMDCSEPNR